MTAISPNVTISILVCRGVCVYSGAVKLFFWNVDILSSLLRVSTRDLLLRLSQWEAGGCSLSASFYFQVNGPITARMAGNAANTCMSETPSLSHRGLSSHHYPEHAEALFSQRPAFSSSPAHALSRRARSSAPVPKMGSHGTCNDYDGPRDLMVTIPTMPMSNKRTPTPKAT